MKTFSLCTFLLLLLPLFVQGQIPLEPYPWRATGSFELMYNFPTETYETIADGPASSTQAETKGGLFGSLSAGAEHSFGHRWAIGAQIGYRQQGLREKRIVATSGETPVETRERWVLHQIALPVYALYRFGKGPRTGFTRLTLTPGFIVSESEGLSFPDLTAPSGLLNLDIELGMEVELAGLSELRLGLIPIGTTLTSLSENGDFRLMYHAVRVQWVWDGLF